MITLEDLQQTAELLNKTWNKKCKNGRGDIEATNGIAGLTLSGRFFSIDKVNEFPNGMSGNDPLTFSFTSFAKGDSMEIFSISSWLFIKPEEGSYMAYGRAKMATRKKKNIDLKGFEKHMLNQIDKVIKAMNDVKAEDIISDIKDKYKVNYKG